MDKLVVQGPAQLSGSIRISSSKNACLPILAACLLGHEDIRLHNLPQLNDVQTMLKLLENLGVEKRIEKGVVVLNSARITSCEATYDLVKTMRASILVLGPLLARFQRAKVSLPGGCAIGARPIDIHLSGLEKMGAHIDLKSGYVEAKTLGLVGADILLPFPSVGATENLMSAAVLARGTTHIKNAACEPEIRDLQNFLNKMGAKISGAGTSVVTIEGVDELKSVDYEVISDRIEAATYIVAGVITNSAVTIENVYPDDLEAILSVLQQMGAQMEVGERHIHIKKRGELKGIHIDTAPHPGFPTDAQAQLMALCTQAEGSSVISEHIFENRFMHVAELNRLGAKISLRGNSAFVEGKTNLAGAPVMCTDLRASAALILAALVAEGETHIQRVYHLDRGYENIDKKLADVGVQIKRIKGPN